MVNPGEDIDGDGVVGDFGNPSQGGDEDGIDNDGNGYVDDLIGWDFKNNDNNPQHSSSYSHGTLMAGLASASTNNTIGVAGISWHSKLMATKVGTFQSISIDKAISGIYYAADNGCGIINMSWYAGAGNSLLKNALNYAFQTKNVVLTAAAGNENDSLKNYPAAYVNVISVAALTESDAKRWNSCFGSWIDVSAPANLLWTTDYQNGVHTYFGSAGATSGASAETAGLAALIKSAAPYLSSSEIKSIIINTTDNIDASNPSYIGLLGTGRINAYSALVDAITPAVPSNFAGSWDNGNPETGHPKLTWDANTEPDLKEYEVWKKVDDWWGNNIEPWAKKASTTNTSYVDNGEIGWDYMANPRVVYYKIRAVDQSNNMSAYTGTQRFDCNNGPHMNAAKGELIAETTLPKSFKLQANYPNPFNPVTTIRYALPEVSSVVLDVYSLSGQKVAGLQNGVQQAGNHTLRFDGSNLASGIYLYRFSAVGQKSGKRFNAIKRMLLIK